MRDVERSRGLGDVCKRRTLLIIVGAVIVAAIVITIIVKRFRKTSTENKILKEDL